MPERSTLQFLGGAGTVTGSKHLVTANGHQLLLDCGLFQGLKALRLRNWQAPPLDPSRLTAVVLSHAHLDHSGYLPLLVRHGFHGPIYCTPGTEDLVRVLLLDAAHLQEEEAERANRYGYSKHKPALPLYTTADAEAALRLTESRTYGQAFGVSPGVTGLFRRAGHILGSATVELQVDGPSPLRVVFSGDLGRWQRPILRDPDMVSEADVLLVESTYGDRIHSPDPAGALAAVIRDAVARSGALIVPAFAVGRAQELIWTIRQLEEAGTIPTLPVFVDSPMAINVTDIYCQHPEDHGLDMKLLMDQHRCPLCCKQYHLVRTGAESKALNDRRGPMIIISASGMATGGRVIHHLKFRLPDEHTTVLLPGFQAAGTRGRALQEGAQAVRIHGQSIPVRARVVTLDGFSAHADRDEILRWARGFRRPPRQTYVVHGEPQAARALAATLQGQLGWNARVALDAETVELM
ncbi:MAG: MBL fold metallo-hydrolase [Deltaproteobacteria bacterium]|nr:MBL fold metallo-hydrolase [Deltaproteobacteria bacterium]MBI3389228.1 MBL fold metallo-hydrolase [Deltaproteobacteria bacterium]